MNDHAVSPLVENEGEQDLLEMRSIRICGRRRGLTRFWRASRVYWMS